MNLARYQNLEYEDCGRGPKYDCWGLTQFFYHEEFGIALPSYVGAYCSSLEGEEVSKLIANESATSMWREVSSPQFGDVVILRVRGLPWHCAVMVENNRFLHIVKGINSCIERLDSSLWNRRIDGYFRHTARREASS